MKIREKTRFHWALPVEAKKASEAEADQSGAVDIKRLIEFAELADASEIESLLTPFGFHMPDPIPLLGMLAAKTKRVSFLLAYRAGLMSPTLFAQQVNTLSQVLGGRLMLNMVAGISPEEQAYYGDHLSHDERYERMDEFLTVTGRLWQHSEPVTYLGKFFDIRDGRLNTRFTKPLGDSETTGGPKIYISGNSKIAQSKAMSHANCWLRYGDTVEGIEKSVGELPNTRGFGIGLRMSVITGASREEALEKAARVVANPDTNWKEFLRGFVSRCDSEAVRQTYGLSEKTEWPSRCLWSGAVPYRGGPALSLVGTYEEVANELNRYRKAGVTEFILSGWPTDTEMSLFSAKVLPIFRLLEEQQTEKQEITHASARAS